MGNACSCLFNQETGETVFFSPEDIPDQDNQNKTIPTLLNNHFMNAMSGKNDGFHEDFGTNENNIIESTVMKTDKELLEKEKHKEKILGKEKLKQREKENESELREKLYLKHKIWRYVIGHLFRKKFKKYLRKELEDYRNKLYEEWIHITKNAKVMKIESNTSTPPYDPQGWRSFYMKDDFQPAFTGRSFEMALVFTYETDKKNYLTDMNPKQMFELATSVYKGQVNLENARQGYGTLIEKSGTKYIGFWSNNNFTGWGRLIKENGTFYQGVFRNGLLNGKGCQISLGRYSYYGDFLNGRKHGEGNEETGEMTYTGSFFNDNHHGKGEMTKKNGDTYKGDFHNSMFHGNGVYKWKKNGHQYDGQYVKGIIHGFGTYKWNDKEYYRGEYANGIKEGKGEFWWEDGKKYVGPFKNGVPHGIGTVEKDGKTEDVEFIDGKINKKFHQNSGSDWKSTK